MIEQQRPLPQPSVWSKPYWDAARRKEFVVQICADCDTPIMYPRKFCPSCLGESLKFRPSAGTGEIYSLTVQSAGAPSGFADKLPYVLAIIKLDEGVQLMSNIVGENKTDAKIGDRVEVDFEAVDQGGTVLPVFRLVKK